MSALFEASLLLRKLGPETVRGAEIVPFVHKRGGTFEEAKALGSPALFEVNRMFWELMDRPHITLNCRGLSDEEAAKLLSVERRTVLLCEIDEALEEGCTLEIAQDIERRALAYIENHRPWLKIGD